MEYGWMLLRMVAVLAAVCGLAYVILRWGLRRFAPFDPDQTGRLEVVERLGVAPKQSLLVVRAGDEYLLIGCSESGFERLGRLRREDWTEEGQTEGETAAEIDAGTDAPEPVGDPM